MCEDFEGDECDGCDAKSCIFLTICCCVIISIIIIIIVILNFTVLAPPPCSTDSDILPHVTSEYCYNNNGNRTCINDAAIFYIKHEDIGDHISYKADVYENYPLDGLIGSYYGHRCTIIKNDDKTILATFEYNSQKYDAFKCDSDEKIYRIEGNFVTDKYVLYQNSKIVLQFTNSYWYNTTDVPDITLINKENELVSIMYIDFEEEDLWKVINFKLDDYPNWIVGSFAYIPFIEEDEEEE